MIAELILLGTLQVTSYRAVENQTKPGCNDRHTCETSIGDGLTMYGAATSPDLFKSGKVHYGSIIHIDGYGDRMVNDIMADKNHNAIDLFVFTHAEEKQVGVQHLKVYVVRVEDR